MDFLEEHKLLEVFQSGFKTLHSTESALLRVFNDILLATDSGECVVLVRLDLTAAFDTVDHEVLISRLEQWVGFRGAALEFKSYLAARTFCVSLGNSVSSSARLPCGVPQSWAPSTFLFTCFHLAPSWGSMGLPSIVMQMTLRYTSLSKRKTHFLSNHFLGVLTT